MSITKHRDNDGKRSTVTPPPAYTLDIHFITDGSMFNNAEKKPFPVGPVVEAFVPPEVVVMADKAVLDNNAPVDEKNKL